jgi:hypothetical protein
MTWLRQGFAEVELRPSTGNRNRRATNYAMINKHLAGSDPPLVHKAAGFRKKFPTLSAPAWDLAMRSYAFLDSQSVRANPNFASVNGVLAVGRRPTRRRDLCAIKPAAMRRT